MAWDGPGGKIWNHNGQGVRSVLKPVGQDLWGNNIDLVQQSPRVEHVQCVLNCCEVSLLNLSCFVLLCPASIQASSLILNYTPRLFNGSSQLKETHIITILIARVSVSMPQPAISHFSFRFQLLHSIQWTVVSCSQEAGGHVRVQLQYAEPVKCFFTITLQSFRWIPISAANLICYVHYVQDFLFDRKLGHYW